ncbi:MAG: phytanoyl-CoA dioxygenase family protein, partial [Planctomycetota bacterium]
MVRAIAQPTAGHLETAMHPIPDTKAYQRDGFLHLPALYAPGAVAAWQAECDRLLASDLVHPDNGRTPFRMQASRNPERIDPVVDISPVFQSLAADRRLIETVALLLGEQPRLFKDKLLLKDPGVAGYRMHQDWAWGWQDLCPADDICSVSIQIDGADPENGAITLFSGYHGSLLTPAGEARNFRDQEIAGIDPARGRIMHTAPGDVLLFHALTPHRSGPNRSDRTRRSLYLTYHAARHGDLRTQYYERYRSDRAYQNGGYFK